MDLAPGLDRAIAFELGSTEEEGDFQGMFTEGTVAGRAVVLYFQIAHGVMGWYSRLGRDSTAGWNGKRDKTKSETCRAPDFLVARCLESCSVRREGM